MWRRWVVALVGGAGLVLLLTACDPPEISLTVTVPFDAVDVDPGDGVCDDGAGNCTLRAAVMEGNAHASASIAVPAGNYVLSIPGAGEDDAASGDLDITKRVAVMGAGAGVVTVDGNAAVTGDRVFEVHAESLLLVGVTVTGGDSPEVGGLQVSGGAAFVLYTTIEGNSSSAGAGGMRVSGGYSLMRNVTIAHNEGVTAGGVEVAAGLLDGLNMTVSSNTATAGAGGVVQGAGTVQLTYTTVTANTGGGVSSAGGFSVGTSVIADQASGDDCVGSMISAGYNVTSDVSCGLAGAGDLVTAEVALGPLADNGSTTETHVPGPTSVLFDRIPDGTAGCRTPVAGDQRLQARPQGTGCEPGAVEAPTPEPMPLGTRTNFLGTGSLLPAADREHFQLAANGPCSSREQGDLLLPVSQANFTTANPPAGGSWAGCTGGTTQPNPLHDPDGYTYTVQVPASWPGGSLAIEAYNAAYCPTSPNATWDASGSSMFTTTFDVVGAGGAVLSTRSFTPNQLCSGGTHWMNAWRALHTVAAPVPGSTYTVRVATSATYTTTTAQQGSNGFALRANRGGGTFEACTADLPTATTGVPHDADCPLVYGTPWTSRFLDFSSGAPTYPVAHVDPAYSGRVLELLLFDPGEGTNAVEVIDPAGNPVIFDWTVDDETGADVMPTGGWSGTTASLDLRGVLTNPCGRIGNPQAGLGRSSAAKYNDRLVRLRVPLPGDLDAAYGDATRWSLRFTACDGGSMTDRSTWRASIVD